MIDFRYHVVSIVAVFLALAVGVVLGSGPLRTALIGELTNESEQLRTDLAAAQEETEAARLQGVLGETFLTQAGPTLLGDSLTGVHVAIIRVNDPDLAEVTAIKDRLVEAGAEVTANVLIEPAWTDPSQTAFRVAFAAQITENVVGVDLTVAPDRVLAHALAQTLIPTDFPEGSGPTDSDPGTSTAADRAKVLLELLRGANLVSGTVSGEVDAVIFVSGPGSEDVDERAIVSELYAQVVGIVEEYAGSVVVATGPASAADITSAIQSSALLSERVTTVTEATNVYGYYVVALALAVEIAGSAGHFGFGEDLTYFPGG